MQVRDELAFILGLIGLAMMIAFIWPEWTGGQIGKFVAGYHAAVSR